MPFFFKSDYSYNELIEYFNSIESGKHLSFRNVRKVILYPKDNKEQGPTYIYTDVDLFPNNEPLSIVKMFFKALDQGETDNVFYKLDLFDIDGDINHFNFDDFFGEPPILGSPN